MSKTPPTEKRPRHYAAEIVALKSRESRAAALARVPAMFRAWVKDLVEDYYWRRGQPHTPTKSEAAVNAGAVKSPAAPAGRTVGQRALSSLREALA